MDITKKDYSINNIKFPEGYLILLDNKNEEDLEFVRQCYGFEVENLGYFRERKRLFMFKGVMNDREARKLLSVPNSPSILEIPEPPVSEGQLTRHLFTLIDGTELTWIRHPRALPKKCRPHWRNHTSMFVVKGKNPKFTAYTSIHSFAVLDGADDKYRLFGPGGTRWIDYTDHEAAISDALDMSLAVAMKIQVVRTPNAGNKIAIYGDLRNKKDMHEALRSIYTAFERLGLIVTSADLGLSLKDLEEAALPVAPTTIVPMGVYENGLPSALVTADAAVAGLEAMAESLPGSRVLGRLTISIQGIGEVGYRMGQRLVDMGAHLIIAESNPETREHFAEEHRAACNSGQVVFLEDHEAIYDVPVDIFVPCASRDILTQKTLKRLKGAGVKIIGGPANNLFPDQVEDPWYYHNARMQVVPYEGIGAGGVTGVAFSVMSGVFGSCPFTLEEKISKIKNYVAKLINWSQRYDLPQQVISDRILFNSIMRRRLLSQEMVDSILGQFAKAFKQEDRKFEDQIIYEYSKKGFFYGAGRYPNGGWSFLR